MSATPETGAPSAAANFASACQALLGTFPKEQADLLARTVIVSIGRDGSRSVFEVDLSDPDDQVEVSTRDLAVLGAASEYVATIRARLIRQIEQLHGS